MWAMTEVTSVRLRGVWREREPLARHTSWRVGGPADVFYVPADRDDLVNFLKSLAPGTPLTWLGLGSNLLVRDGGVRGVVLCTHGALSGIRHLPPWEIYAEAGVPGAKIARFAAARNLAGGEFFAGIPGTLGGALAMNAGAFGSETWRCVASVETVDRTGTVRTRQPADYRIGYRHVQGPEGEWFLAARLRLVPGDGGQSRAAIRELLLKRARTQPLAVANAGSVFRNPPGDHAGRLIEAAGLKGLCVGGAQVSERHANFIVNTGTASARDIETLIERVRAEVERRWGVRLEPEVHVVGEPV
jgi:UDP-N-acetylmuramate dehydrogenase